MPPSSNNSTPIQRRNSWSWKSELSFLDSPQPTFVLAPSVKAELTKKRSLQNLRRGNSIKSEQSSRAVTPTQSLQRGNSLKADMKAMLEDDKYFDVIFICSDNIEVRGARAILSARSDALDRLLHRGNGTKRDSSPAKIALPEISSRPFRVVLRYIYTEIIPPLSPVEILSVYRAASLLSLPRLQARLLGRISRTIEEPGAAVPLLTEAVAIMPTTTDNRQLYDTLLSVFCVRPLSVGDLADLSPSALELLLLGTKTKPFLTTEYDLLLCVVDWAWSLCKSPPVVMERRRSFDLILENTRAPPSSSTTPPSTAGTLSKRDGLTPMPLDEVKHLLSRVTTHIDLTLICPHRLAHFIDRIDVLPHEHLLLAFRHHACRQNSCILGHALGLRGTFFRWDPPVVHPHLYALRVSEDGACVENWEYAREGHVFTVRSAHPLVGPGIYEWDVIIESSGLVDAQESRYRWDEIGLVDATAEIAADIPMSEQPGGWCFRTFGSSSQVVHGEEDEIYGTGFGQGDVVRVHLDMRERACVFSVNGEMLPVAWENLPEKVYPSVTVCPFAKYRIRPIL
ncbi:hypothetical protein BC937DRAFT_86414, partial [Endogone sp. FLAS-F59071]